MEERSAFEERVLAVDVGTQSVRVMAFDARGRVVDGVRLEYDRPYDSPRPGWAEQDADHYLIKMGEACRMMWSRGRVAPESLSGLCLTSQRSTVIYLDRAGKPLRPAILWLDQRRAGRLPRLPLHWRLLFGLTGLSPTLHQLMAEAETNWVREKQPEILERAEHICFLSAYLNYKLTGQMADSVANQVGYLPFDYKRFRWCSPSAWKSAAVPGVLDKMVELVPPGERLGQITAQASSLTGLPKGLAVIAGASDKACEVLGAGCLEPDQGCIGLGTTATINVNSAKYIEPIPLVPPYPSAKRGEYNLEVQTFRGFWLVTWFKEQFGQIEVATAREKGIPAEVLLDEIAARTPPGALGLSLQPYWTPGVRFPGPEAKGAIIGFGSAHGKGHLYRAILEGLAFSLRFGRERIEKEDRGQDDQPDRLRGRFPERPDDADRGRRLRVGDGPALPGRGLGPGGGGVGRGRGGAPSRAGPGRRGHDRPRPGLPAQTGGGGALRRALSEGPPPDVPAAQAGLPGHHGADRVSGKAGERVVRQPGF